MSDVKTDARFAKVVHIVRPGSDKPDAWSRSDFESFLPVIELVINRGAEQGVKLGDRFLVFGDGPQLVDPDSGKDLGQLELVRGQGEVVHVQEQLATIRTTGRRRMQPTKRVIRERTTMELALLGVGRGNVIEEELAPETEIPFEAVRLGDHAKPI